MGGVSWCRGLGPVGVTLLSPQDADMGRGGLLWCIGFGPAGDSLLSPRENLLSFTGGGEAAAAGGSDSWGLGPVGTSLFIW